MEFSEVVRRRKMVRSYTDEPVDPAVVELALRNATRAPSAGFTQGWSFLVLNTPEDTARYWDILAGDEEWEANGWLTGMRTAPVLVIPCASKGAYLSRYAEDDKGWTDEDEARWPMPFWYMDTAMAVMLILQTVVDEELGACYFGIPPRHGDQVRATFSIPEGIDPIGMVSIGHPAPTGAAPGSSTRRARKPLDSIVHHGTWGAS